MSLSHLQKKTKEYVHAFENRICRIVPDSIHLRDEPKPGIIVERTRIAAGRRSYDVRRRLLRMGKAASRKKYEGNEGTGERVPHHSWKKGRNGRN